MLKANNEAQPEQKQLDPKEQKEIDVYTNGMINFLYNKKTGPQVYEMLKSAPPEKSIPQTTLTINSRMEQAISSKGQKPSLSVLLASNMNLMGELVTIGEAGGFFQLSQEELQPILKDTIQTYIQNGLKNKTIDPIELQQAIEPMMNEEQKAQGMEAAQATGVPGEPGQEAAMERYAEQRVGQERQQMQSQMEARQNSQQPQGQLQQAAAQGGGQ